jgi:hypothetical protein
MASPAPTTAPVSAPRHPSLPSVRRAFAIAVGIGLAHTVLVWGYAGLPWSEQGVWLHAIERTAAGDVPYRDFAWHASPLALWVLAAKARILGPGLGGLSAVTTVWFVALLAAYVLYVRLLKPEVLTAAVLAGLFFALAYPNYDGVPLPLGTVNPGVMLGALLLLCGAALAVAHRERPLPIRALGTAGAGALAVLSAPEFWAPALYLGVAAVIRLLGSDHPRRRLFAAATGLLFAGALTAGASLVALTAGAEHAGAALTGGGSLGAGLTYGLPSWERLDVQLVAAGAQLLLGVASLWLCLAITDAKAAQWSGLLLLAVLAAGALHLGMSIATAQDLMTYGTPAALSPVQSLLVQFSQTGTSLIGAAFGVLDNRIERHLLPAILPVILFLMVLLRGRHWQEPRLRRQVLFLLGLCIAARLYRGFGGVAWYHFLLEIPVYTLCVQLGAGAWGPKAGRAVLTALSVAVFVGIYEYYGQSAGRFTRRGPFPAVATARGTVHWPAFAARDIAAIRTRLDSLDPSRTRPVLGFGRTGGWNYLLGRPGAAHTVAGFPADFPPVAALAPFLVDVPFLATSEPEPRVQPGRWDLAWSPGRLAAVDRPRFDAWKATCAPVAFGDSARTVLALWDCSAAPTPPGSSP